MSALFTPAMLQSDHTASPKTFSEIGGDPDSRRPTPGVTTPAASSVQHIGDECVVHSRDVTVRSHREPEDLLRDRRRSRFTPPDAWSDHASSVVRPTYR